MDLRRTIFALIALAAGAPLGAQGTAGGTASKGGDAVLVGFVRDSAGAPVATAGVQLDGDGQWIAVSARGEFRFRGLEAGPHLLRVRALGFAAVEGALTLAAHDSITVDVTLARAAAALDTVRAVAPANPGAAYGPPEFQERRRRGGGFFMTRDEFEKRAPSRLTDLLVNIPGVARRPVESQMGTTEYVLVMRGVSTVKGEICPINFFLDGRNLDLGRDDIDRVIRPDDVEAIEVYPGSARLPARYQGPTSRCGVIAIWTRGSAR